MIEGVEKEISDASSEQVGGIRFVKRLLACSHSACFKKDLSFCFLINFFSSLSVYKSALVQLKSPQFTFADIFQITLIEVISGGSCIFRSREVQKVLQKRGKYCLPPEKCDKSVAVSQKKHRNVGDGKHLGPSAKLE